MNSSGTFVVLLAIATIVSLVSRRLRIPYTVALVVAGLALGASHALPAVSLTRELLFTLVLPGLLFDAAFDIELEELERDGLTLAILAVPAVLVAVAITALALGPTAGWLGAALDEIPAPGAALMFGAVVSATDPVAVVGLFRALDAPRRLQVIIEGESLFNDGTAVILVTLLIGRATGTGVTANVLFDFLYIVGAAAFIGAAIGLTVAELVRRLHDPTLEVMVTTIAAYGSFVAAERLSASGVIATVTAGILCGGRSGRSGLSAPARIAAAAFWDYVAFALNSLVFLMIGLMVQLSTLLDHWRPILAAYVVMTLTRVAITSGCVAGLRGPHRLPFRWTAILSWGGLRGALSMVLALSLPDSFPQRELIVTMTFGVVILSILVQGVTVGPALKWLGLTRAAPVRIDYAETRTALLHAHSSLADLERTGSLLFADAGMRKVLDSEYDEGIERAERELADLGGRIGATEEAAAAAARELLIRTERERVLDAFQAGSLTEEERDRRLARLEARRWY